MRAANAYADGPRRAVEVLELTLLLIARHEAGGPVSDLDAAAGNTRHVLGSPMDETEDEVRLRSALGVVLRHRYAAAGAGSDLDEAIGLAREVLDATRPDHHARASRLSDLAEALLLRFGRDGERADLDEAVEAARAAASLRSGVEHPVLVSRWAAALLLRFEALGDPGDLDAAITARRIAVETTPAGHPARAERVNALGLALRRRGERFSSAPDLAEADSLLAAPPPVPDLPGPAPTSAVPSPPDPAGPIPTSAVPSPPEPARPIPTSTVPHPPEPARPIPTSGVPGFAEAEADNYPGIDADSDPVESAERVLAAAAPGDPDAAWRALEVLETGRSARLDRALGRPGARTPLRDLLGEAAAGTVVTFAVGRNRSHALLLTPAGITAVELPGLSHDILTMRATAFRTGLRIAATAVVREDAQQAISGTLAWLWQTVARPVLDALGHPARPGADPESLPRVWWAPGGLLGTMPLHAAGLGADTVPDRVVSSYTPTISALRYARRPAAPATGQRPLVVAPSSYLPPPALVTDAVSAPPTAAFVEQLPGHSIVHFACRGWTDPEDPSRSGLLLPGDAGARFPVAGLLPARMESVRLAYLAAGQTAVTRSDEAVHVASALQLAGCRHVVGTLWEVDDDDVVADDFYAVLDRDPARSAVALHRAVRRARDRSPGLPWLWATYTHTGA